MTATLPCLLFKARPRDAVSSVPRPDRFPAETVRRGMRCPQRLISPECCLIIQTIRRDPSRSDQIDEASNVSRPDPSGADQIDAKHQATDLMGSGGSGADKPPEDQSEQ
jgi:hypothetical protein